MKERLIVCFVEVRAYLYDFIKLFVFKLITREPNVGMKSVFYNALAISIGICTCMHRLLTKIVEDILFLEEFKKILSQI